MSAICPNCGTEVFDSYETDMKRREAQALANLRLGGMKLSDAQNGKADSAEYPHGRPTP